MYSDMTSAWAMGQKYLLSFPKFAAGQLAIANFKTDPYPLNIYYEPDRLYEWSKNIEIIIESFGTRDYQTSVEFKSSLELLIHFSDEE